jgi:hypothetical protein
MNAALDENDEAMVVGEEIGCTVFKLQLVVGPPKLGGSRASRHKKGMVRTYVLRTTYYSKIQQEILKEELHSSRTSR